MNFVHIEIFERPDLLLDAQGEPQVRSTVREWGLQIEPVVFLVGPEGRIADRFEGFSPRLELEPAVRALLSATSATSP